MRAQAFTDEEVEILIYRWRLIIATCAEHSRLQQLHLCASAYPPEGLYIWQLFNARYIENKYTAFVSSSIRFTLGFKEMFMERKHLHRIASTKDLPYNVVFAYLSTILDAFTKQVLAYVTSPSLEVDFVLETVDILIQAHGTELKTKTLLHSGRGCHYTFAKYLRQSGCLAHCSWE